MGTLSEEVRTEVLCGRICALEAENAKLRELCINMHVWMGRALYENSARKYEYELITERMDDLGVSHD